MIRNARFRLLAAPALTAALVAFAAPALAEEDRDATADEISRVTKALEGKGYKNVRDVEVDDGRFEVDAVHPDGHEVDLELDMTTLEIVHEKRD